MSCEEFDPNCEGCRPALLDPETGEFLKRDHPLAKVVHDIWESSTLEEQRAFWRITVKNSRLVEDLETVQPLLDKLEKAAFTPDSSGMN